LNLARTSFTWWASCSRKGSKGAELIIDTCAAANASSA
jgi:hypothetical protein